MCLGVPGRIVSMENGEALVDFWGVQRIVRLDIVDEPVVVGDYILNHVGQAIRRIPPETVAATLAMYEELLAAEDDDPMRADIAGEIAGTGRGGAA